MRWLELKVPPPVAALACAALMGWLARPAGVPWGVASVAAAVAGAGLMLAAAVQFRRARTTINPLRPEGASSLVTGGVFAFSRNPIYVADALLLLAWAAWLARPVALVGIVAFVAYVTRFQIVPEERALTGRFGDAYRDYCARVRRWL